MKKYQLTTNTYQIGSHILYQIQALIDIPKYNVKKGDLGGYIESEENLSHEKNSWVSQYAKVYQNARVYGNAFVSSAEISGNVQIFENAKIYSELGIFGNGGGLFDGNAKIYGNARIKTDGIVYVGDDVELFGNTDITNKFYLGSDIHFSGKAKIGGNSKISVGKFRVADNVKIFDCEINSMDLCLQDNVYLSGGKIECSPILREFTQLRDNAVIRANSYIAGNCIIGGDVRIDCNVCLPRDAILTQETDLFYAKNIGRYNGEITVYKSSDRILVHYRNDESTKSYLYPMDEFLSLMKYECFTKEVKEFELLLEVAKSRILGNEYIEEYNEY